MSLELTPSLVLGLAASCVHLVGYGAYARLLVRGDIVPNPTSWSLWALGSIIAVSSYGGVTRDIAKLALPVVCCLASIIIAVMTMFQARFPRPDLADVGVAAMDGGIIIVWWLSRNADLTYAWLLIDLLLTFVPIIRSTYRNPDDERAAPWLIWTAAYGMLFGVCLMRWEGVEAVLLPAVYLVCHLAVGILATRGRAGHQAALPNPRNSPPA